MSEPTTAAGRALLKWDDPAERWHVARCPAIPFDATICTCRGAMAMAVRDIEAEAAAADRARLAGLVRGLHASGLVVPDDEGHVVGVSLAAVIALLEEQP